MFSSQNQVLWRTLFYVRLFLFNAGAVLEGVGEGVEVEHPQSSGSRQIREL
jgi:hypothetical protein